MKISKEELARIAACFTILSHTRGRLRARVDPKITQKVEGLRIEHIEEIPERIEGIEKIRVNPLNGSVTIHYDHRKLPKDLWEDLVNGENIEACLERIQMNG